MQPNDAQLSQVNIKSCSIMFVHACSIHASPYAEYSQMGSQVYERGASCDVNARHDSVLSCAPLLHP
jgi:hypothetical protein